MIHLGKDVKLNIFAQKAKKPIITIPGPQCMQTILIASTRTT